MSVLNFPLVITQRRKRDRERERERKIHLKHKTKTIVYIRNRDFIARRTEEEEVMERRELLGKAKDYK